MNLVYLKDDLRIKALVKRLIPGYKKHSVFVGKFCNTRINSYWDGGSRSEFMLFKISGQQIALPSAGHPMFSRPEADRTTLNGIEASVACGIVYLTKIPPDSVLIEVGTFCGKPATAKLYFS